LGDPETAGRTLNIARRAKVETPAYYTVSGRVANSNGLTADARSAFDSAVRMDSSYAPAYLERGLLYVKEDRLDAGLRDLNNYLKLLGRDVTGTKANEIRMLTNQLQRTIETSRRPS
jgi:tetratricopeptide (TPR) repeat protein